MSLHPATCYRALVARDARFDGVFFVGVRTTGIYCRPICTARTPARDRCTFFSRAVEAEREGYRACLRCRPELAPGSANVDSLSRLVGAAVERIDAGALVEGSVEALAAELGVTARHLRRAFSMELGVTPLELAQSKRMAVAKQLVQGSDLGMSEIAFASGFRSVRRFNAAFRSRFGRSPSELRRTGGERSTAIAIRLDYRPPLDWEPLLAFVAAHAVPRVESARDGVYRRTVALGEKTGWLTVAPQPGRAALRAEISSSLATELVGIVARLRAMFDLDAHPTAISAHLGADPGLAGLVEARPGMRIAGAFDPFEVVSRAIVGQQITVRAATTLSERLVAHFGAEVVTPFAEIDRAFPSAERIAGASEDEVASIGMPRARARALVAAAGAIARGEVRLGPGEDAEQAVAALVALPGIGPWTAQYVAMRGLGWPDGFPPADVGLMRALGVATPRELTRRAEPWRPWRAYAAMHLWTVA